MKYKGAAFITSFGPVKRTGVMLRGRAGTEALAFAPNNRWSVKRPFRTLHTCRTSGTATFKGKRPGQPGVRWDNRLPGGGAAEPAAERGRGHDGRRGFHGGNRAGAGGVDRHPRRPRAARRRLRS